MRVFLFNKGKNVSSLSLKKHIQSFSESEALKLHLSRAHFQTTVWLTAIVLFPERMDLETCGPLQQLTETKAFAFKTCP